MKYILQYFEQLNVDMKVQQINKFNKIRINELFVYFIFNKIFYCFISGTKCVCLFMYNHNIYIYSNVFNSTWREQQQKKKQTMKLERISRFICRGYESQRFAGIVKRTEFVSMA